MLFDIIAICPKSQLGLFRKLENLGGYIYPFTPFVYDPGLDDVGQVGSVARRGHLCEKFYIKVRDAQTKFFPHRWPHGSP